MSARTFGGHFKERRIAIGMTLRAFCELNGFDPGNISRLERSLLPPPQTEPKLVEYAEALGLKRGQDEWLDFFDLAAAESGRIPQEILADEEIVEKLPVLFRTLRGDKVTEADLDRLLEKIRRA